MEAGADQLTALDATFLELEEADECAHMHIGAVMLLEPSDGGGAPPIDRVRVEILGRLKALPRYRRRLSSPRTGGLSWPSWEPDPDFGYEVAASVPGIDDPGILRPRLLYTDQDRATEYDALVEALHHDRRAHMAAYPDLRPEIADQV